MMQTFLPYPSFLESKGYEVSLARYGHAICEEWIKRGFKDSLREKFERFLDPYIGKLYLKPTWFGNKKFHSSHRSNLLRKNKEHYSQFGWTELDNLPYVWPESGSASYDR
jgi:hypothetical protein